MKYIKAYTVGPSKDFLDWVPGHRYSQVNGPVFFCFPKSVYKSLNLCSVDIVYFYSVDDMQPKMCSENDKPQFLLFFWPSSGSLKPNKIDDSY